MKINLAPLPHAEASRLIQGKPPVVRQVFDAMLPDLRARAFLISGIEDANVLQRVRDRISDIPLGADWIQTRNEIIQDVSPYLVTATDPDEREKQVETAYRRAELLVRTHTFQAYEAASYNAMRATRAAFPFWQYMTMDDGNVRPEHAALNGLVLPADSPFWRDHYPPWDWGCRCTVVPLAPEDVDEIRAEDRDRAPEERLVLTPELEERMVQNGELMRGPIKLIDPNDPARRREIGRLPGGKIDVRSPRERAVGDAGRKTAFQWDPGDLRISLTQLRERYDPATWSVFEAAMRDVTVTLMNGQSVHMLQWLAMGGQT